ncbi:hypothetical protein GCM10027035_44960 [Emticicia sediminis]
MKQTIILLLISLTSFAQKIQWANQVIGYTSDTLNAIKILGMPDVERFKEENKNRAWHPNQEIEKANITVGFEKPMKVRQVVIVENAATGNITVVKLIGVKGKEEVIFRSQTLLPHLHGHFWDLKLDKPTDDEITAIYIEVNPTLSNIFPTEIDAIAISDTIINIERFEKKKVIYNHDVKGDKEKKISNLPINLPDDVPKNIVKENLGININSSYSEVSPVVSLDESLLFFTTNRPKDFEVRAENTSKSRRSFDQDIWASEKDEKGKWIKAKNLYEPFNTREDNAATSISADGNKVYLLNQYLPNGRLVKGLSTTLFDGSNWNTPQTVNIEDYYNYASYTEFALNYNENVMLIASARNKADTLNQNRDIFVSFLQKNGKWSSPKYTGDMINSKLNEGSPFIAADSKTIYFSSNGFGNYGEADIFMAKRLDSTWTNWSEPINLGKGINTSKWDGYFWVSASGNYAYMSSTENSMGSEDIFKVNLYPSIKPEPVAILTGRVLDEKGKPVATEIIMKDFNETKFEDYRTNTNVETGEYILIVPLRKDYYLKVVKEGFQSLEKNIYLKTFNSLQNLNINLTLFFER